MGVRMKISIFLSFIALMNSSYAFNTTTRDYNQGLKKDEEEKEKEKEKEEKAQEEAIREAHRKAIEVFSQRQNAPATIHGIGTNIFAQPTSTLPGLKTDNITEIEKKLDSISASELGTQNSSLPTINNSPSSLNVLKSSSPSILTGQTSTTSLGLKPTANDCLNGLMPSIVSNDAINSFQQVVDKIENVPQKARFTLDIQPSSAKREWDPKYTDSLYQTLSEPSFEEFLKQKIDDEDLKKANCPEFNDLDNEDKKKFYIVYLAAIAEAGSDYNTEDASYSKGDGTTNYGLLQIDPKSAKAHAGSVLEKPIDASSLKQYQNNLKAGAYVLKHQIAGKIATGRLFPDKTYYWPTLKYSQSRILGTMSSNASNLPFCNKAPETQALAESTQKDSATQPETTATTGSTTTTEPTATTPTTTPELTLTKSSVAPSMNKPYLTTTVPTLTNSFIHSTATPAPIFRRPPLAPVAPAAKEGGSWLSKFFSRKPSSSSPTYSWKQTTVNSTRVPLRPSIPRTINYNDYPVQEDGLNKRAFAKYLSEKPEIGDGWCAKEVRLSLNELFGVNIENGRNGKDFDKEFLKNYKKDGKCYSETNDSEPQNYDIRSLEPDMDYIATLPRRSDGSLNVLQFGHAEIYFEGEWYSDFKQINSVWNEDRSLNPAFKSKTQYRFGPCK